MDVRREGGGVTLEGATSGGTRHLPRYLQISSREFYSIEVTQQRELEWKSHGCNCRSDNKHSSDVRLVKQRRR